MWYAHEESLNYVIIYCDVVHESFVIESSCVNHLELNLCVRLECQNYIPIVATAHSLTQANAVHKCFYF